jgi:hypothetical protein
MRYAYEALLWFYPNSYRGVFGREMAIVFEQAERDYHSRGFLAYCAFLGTEFAGLIAEALWLRTDRCILWSQTRLRPPFVACLLAGAMLAALSDACVIAKVGNLGQRDFMRAQISDTTHTIPDGEVILWLGCSTVLLVSLLSLAFVWNLRNIRKHSGVTKPNREALGFQATIAHG